MVGGDFPEDEGSEVYQSLAKLQKHSSLSVFCPQEALRNKEVSGGRCFCHRTAGPIN